MYLESRAANRRNCRHPDPMNDPTKSEELGLVDYSSAPISVGRMLQSALQSGVTKENVDVLEKLMNLYERDQTRQAELAYNRAFAALQADRPKIVAVTPVPDRDGNIKYHFARYEEIDEKMQPFLEKHGFAVSFKQSYGDGTVTQTCIIRHRDGHKEENPFKCRIGKGPPGASEAQADGAASTYAKRHAYCNAFNIIIDPPDSDGAKSDVRDIGAPISRDKVTYLAELLKETNSDLPKFLAVAGVKSLEEIGEGSYSVLVNLLLNKRR